MKPLFLYGPPASGKTTLGKQLARQMNVPFTDLDDAVWEHDGRDIPKIFKQDGESGFRDIESRTLEKVIAEGQAGVIALGGGTLLRDANRSLCESAGTVLCLDAPSPGKLAERLGKAPGSRPLGDQSRTRAEHYASFSRRIADSFVASPSLVIVGNGIAVPIVGATPCVIDATVSDCHELPKAVFKIPSGEQNKTLQTVAAIWHAFAEAGLGRKDRVAAIGGGVTGDLTGFAAATWMRGIDWINVPTTLLAMVDASTGGKTGCDLPEGKNMIGAFHAPKLVIVDTDFLKTLSPQLIACGKAEMIKHEIIVGRQLPKIADNLRVKANIVGKDPHETKGLRILLNCGHTVAHAIEKLTNYTVTHGEAVAIGCVEEARFAVRLGLAEKDWPKKLSILFKRAGLPTELPDGIDFARMKPVMRGDKKRAGNVVTFALPCGWGKVCATPVDLS